MGMDVLGRKPKSETGASFECKAPIWAVLWCYYELPAPAIAAKVERADSNDGDGLGADDAEALARALRAHIANGHAAAFSTRVAEDFYIGLFEVWFLREFVEFLEACGGFVIW